MWNNFISKNFLVLVFRFSVNSKGFGSSNGMGSKHQILLLVIIKQLNTVDPVLWRVNWEFTDEGGLFWNISLNDSHLPWWYFNLNVSAQRQLPDKLFTQKIRLCVPENIAGEFWHICKSCRGIYKNVKNENNFNLNY